MTPPEPVAADPAATGSATRAATGSAIRGPAGTASAATASAITEPAATPGHQPSPGADLTVVIWIVLLAAATALVGTAFLPLHIGAVPLPISVLLGPIVLWWAPRAVHRLTGSVVAAVLPAAAWLVVAGWLSIARNGVLPGQPYGVHDGQWRVMLLLGLGALTGAAALSLVWGEHVRRQVAASSAGGRPGAGGPPGGPVGRRTPAG